MMPGESCLNANSEIFFRIFSLRKSEESGSAKLIESRMVSGGILSWMTIKPLFR